MHSGLYATGLTDAIGVNPGSWCHDPRFWDGGGHGVFLKYYCIL